MQNFSLKNHPEILAMLLAVVIIVGSLQSSLAFGLKDSPSHRSWSGCYAGLQAGYSWGDVSGVGSEYDGSFPGYYSMDMDGFIGGAFVGCNRQTNRLVLGLEADIDYSNADGLTHYTEATPLTYRETSEIKWLGSVRGRVGILARDALFYLTAGWAFGKTEQTVYEPTLPFSDKHSKTRHGWTIGGGFEKFINERLIMRLEYRYVELEGYTDSKPVPVNSRDIVDDTDISIARVGFAAKF